MKKTIVAAAVAALVAAPAAFADVSISGQINQEFYENDATSGDNAANGDLRMDTNADLVFKGSEDLGNGMKASFTFAQIQDEGTLAAGSTTTMGLSGDFGSIRFGDMETFIENKVAAMAANDASDTFSNEVTAALGASSTGSIEYVAPTMNGLTLVLAASTSNAANTDDFDTTQVGVQYVAGPLTVRAATAENATTSEAVVAASYKMGDITGTYVQSDAAGNDKWFGLSYTMGANTFAVSTRDSDTAANEDDTISVKHALSKSTSVGVTYFNDGDTSATTNTDGVIISVAHKF